MHHERVQKVFRILGWLSAPLLIAIEESETPEEWNPDHESAVCRAFAFDNANIELPLLYPEGGSPFVWTRR